MQRTTRSALVLCPEAEPSGGAGRRLLGLTVGERLLLALRFEGVERVAFVGPGARPASPRAEIEVVPPESLVSEGDDGGFFLLPADLVFDRRMLSAPEGIPESAPIKRLPADALGPVIAAPGAWLEKLGSGLPDPGPGFALRVTDRRSARRAGKALLAALRKPIDGFISRNLNRHISLFFSSWLVRTGIRPNQLTGLILGMGAASALCAAFPERSMALLLAAILFQGQSIFDGCDGEIARLTYRFSPLGQWLDTIGDDLTNYLFCLGLAIGQARVLGAPWLYAAGGLTFATQLALSGIMYQRIAKMGTGDLLALPDTLTKGQYTGVVGLALRFFRLITKRDFFVFTIAVITALGQPLAAFITMAVGTYIAFAGVFTNELRLRRQDQSTSSE